MKLITTEVETSYISPGNKDKIAYGRREHGKEILIPEERQKKAKKKIFNSNKRYVLSFIANNRRFPRKPTLREYRHKYGSIYEAIYFGQHACQPFFIYDLMMDKLVLTSY